MRVRAQNQQGVEFSAVNFIILNQLRKHQYDSAKKQVRVWVRVVQPLFSTNKASSVGASMIASVGY